MLSEDEYRKLVLKDFDQKVAAGLLPELTAPTRKSIKDHGITVCIERYHQRDEPLLHSFLGKKDNPSAYLIAMQNVSAEEFRTLNNFLNNRHKKTAFKNIRLLAWLADFELRPYVYELEVSPPLPPEPIIVDGTNDMDVYPPPLPPKPETIGEDEKTTAIASSTLTAGPINPPQIWPKVLTICILLLVIGGGLYLWLGAASPANNPNGSEPLKPRVLATNGDTNCMIWNMDHFQAVSFQSRPAGTLAFRTDSADLAHFSKIMQPETLSVNSIGKVWYFKGRDSIEYFTAEGFHPIYRDRRLKRLSEHMLPDRTAVKRIAGADK